LHKSLIKTFTWRLIGTTSTFVISYLITGMMLVSSGIAIFQMIVNTILYYLHEIFWESK